MKNRLIDKVMSILTDAHNSVKQSLFDAEIDNDLEKSWRDQTNNFIKKIKENKIGFSLVDRYGGEDQGSDYWSVYSFSDGMQVVFVKFDGWYASYDGSTYEEFYEVKPVEKTITVYEKK
jgi:predicted KAP-like P-loop ATPase